MVGINKPTVHFYTKSIILYENNTIKSLVNLSERLELEKRIGWEGSEIGKSPGSDSVLILIDQNTSELQHWKKLDPIELGRFGIYKHQFPRASLCSANFMCVCFFNFFGDIKFMIL